VGGLGEVAEIVMMSVERQASSWACPTHRNTWNNGKNWSNWMDLNTNNHGAVSVIEAIGANRISAFSCDDVGVGR
jgi:hypothetical protein